MSHKQQRLCILKANLKKEGVNSDTFAEFSEEPSQLDVLLASFLSSSMCRTDTSGYVSMLQLAFLCCIVFTLELT